MTYMLIILVISVAVVLIGIGSSLETANQKALRREIAWERRQRHERRMELAGIQPRSPSDYDDD